MEAHVNDLNAALPASANSALPTDARPTDAREPTAAERRLAELIVSALQLEVSAQDIKPDALLFNGGLGLDSIDALELALAISREHGIELRSDDQRNHQIFASLASLSAYVEAHRARGNAVAPPSP